MAPIHTPVSALVCAGCYQPVPSKQYLTCYLCKNSYDLECANVSTTRFYGTMTLEHKKTWKCPACYCNTPKTGNIDTPVRSVKDLEGIQQERKLTGRQNVTLRTHRTTVMRSDTSDSEDLSILGDTQVVGEKSQITNTEPELTLQNLNEIIILRLKENNKSIIRDLQKTIETEINKAVLKVKQDITQDTDALYNQNELRKQEIEKLNTKIEILTKETEKLKNEIQELKTNDTIKITNENKRYYPESNYKKIVLYGLDEYFREPDHALNNRIIEMFRDIMNVDLEGYIEETYRIGRHTNNGKRPLVIELISKRMTKYLLENNSYFQGTTLNISGFLDEQARKERRSMREKMLTARKQGLHAVIRNNQLFIEGKNSLSDETNKTMLYPNIVTQPKTQRDRENDVEFESSSFRNNNSFRKYGPRRV